MAYGLEVAERQYDAQYPENEMPAELVCSMCGYTEKRGNTYTVDDKIMCEGCFDDFCKEQYDDYGADFFSDHKDEYVKDWFESLDDADRLAYMTAAFDSHLAEAEEMKARGCDVMYVFVESGIKDFCLHHGDWQDYITQKENVTHN